MNVVVMSDLYMKYNTKQKETDNNDNNDRYSKRKKENNIFYSGKVLKVKYNYNAYHGLTLLNPERDFVFSFRELKHDLRIAIE